MLYSEYYHRKQKLNKEFTKKEINLLIKKA